MVGQPTLVTAQCGHDIRHAQGVLHGNRGMPSGLQQHSEDVLFVGCPAVVRPGIDGDKVKLVSSNTARPDTEIP